jgi:hypothetical protein
MATESEMQGPEPDLRPTRWPTLPRGGTLLRTALVAALLALGAGVLYAREPGQSCPAGRAPTAPDGAATTPAPTRADGSAARLSLPTGTVGVPVRLAEPAALAVIRPGVRVDLLAVPATAGGRSTSSTEPTVVAARALVLDVVGAGVSDGSNALYLALPPDQAQRAVGMPEGIRFAIIVRP